MGTKSIAESRTQKTLRQIQFRLQMAAERELTHSELAKLAGVGTRALGDWMRGVTSPPGMSAILELLAILPTVDAVAVLGYWQKCLDQPLTNSAKQSGDQTNIPTKSKKPTRRKQMKEGS